MGKHSSQDSHDTIGGVFTSHKAGRHANEQPTAASILRSNRRTPVMAAIAIPTAAVAALGVAGFVNGTPSGDKSASVAADSAQSAPAAQTPKPAKQIDEKAHKAAQEQGEKDESGSAKLSTPKPTHTQEPKRTPSQRPTEKTSHSAHHTKKKSTAAGSETKKKSPTKSKKSGSSEESFKGNSKASGQSGSCPASTYGEGDGTAGGPTASGETFNPSKLTAAHKTLPLGSKVKVTNKSNSKSVTVRINDRGPYSGARCLDLSTAAMDRIGGDGVAQVSWKVL